MPLGLGILARGERQSRPPSLAAQIIRQFVSADGKQIALQRPLAIVIRQAVEESNKRFLDDVFSSGSTPQATFDKGQQSTFITRDQIAPGIQPVEVEREFLIDMPGTRLPLKGYIDLIDDQRCIIDHKTTKRSFPENTAEKDVQLTAYSLAFRTLYGKKENGVRLDVMVRNKQPKIQQLPATRTQADIDRFSRLAGQVENAISSGVYYPNEGYMCGICGYQEMCEKW